MAIESGSIGFAMISSILPFKAIRSHPRSDTAFEAMSLDVLSMTRLYTAILNVLEVETQYAIQFTSAHPGAGTSRIASSLAEAISRSGARVGSIDMNGQSEFDTFRAHRSLRAQRESIGLRDGGIAPAKGTAATMFKELPYDFLIVDTPPILSSAVSLGICANVSGTVVVVEAEHTSEAAIHSTLNTIQDCGGRCIGLVLNKKKTGWWRVRKTRR